MRKLMVAEHISLDGVIQAPGGREEDTSGGFRFGGWTVPYGTEDDEKSIVDLHSQPFELLLGRHTYDIWAPYWPHQPAGNAIADAFNGTIKHVATHRPESLTWSVSRAISGDLGPAVRELKASEGPDLLTWGSSEVVRQLMKEGLVDTLWLFLHPVVLGAGKRLFDGEAMPSAFEVTRAVNTSTGVQILRLARNGEVRTGSYT